MNTNNKARPMRPAVEVAPIIIGSIVHANQVKGSGSFLRKVPQIIIRMLKKTESIP